MPDLKQAQPTAGTAVRKLDPELSKRLIALGFDPEASVYEADERFKYGQVARLVNDGRTGPKVLRFGHTEYRPPHGESEWVVPVLVELLTVRFETDTRAGDGPGHRCKMPQFYIRGFLTDTPTDSPPDAPRVHILVDTHDYEEDWCGGDTAYIQIVHEPSPPNPDAVLVFGEGSPVQNA